MKWPIDAPLQRVLGALIQLGFAVVREGSHIALRRSNPAGSSTPMENTAREVRVEARDAD